MTQKTDENLEVIKNNSRARENEFIRNSEASCHTNPIVRKLLDFGSADKTRRFSVRDLLKR